MPVTHDLLTNIITIELADKPVHRPGPEEFVWVVLNYCEDLKNEEGESFAIVKRRLKDIVNLQERKLLIPQVVEIFSEPSDYMVAFIKRLLNVSKEVAESE